MGEREAIMRSLSETLASPRIFRSEFKKAKMSRIKELFDALFNESSDKVSVTTGVPEEHDRRLIWFDKDLL